MAQTPTTNAPTPPAPHQDLEVKDAQLIFNSVWDQLEADVGRDALRFPKELILLGGAPGAGKGTNTGFIMKARAITGEPLVVSSLLTGPEARALIDRGELVGDREVVGLLFRRLLDPIYRDGAILDGFPRTKVQVECMKLLVDKLNDLHRSYKSTPLARHFLHPAIHVVVLFVTEKTSVQRQLARGEKARAHNAKVQETGEGELMEVRETDSSVDAARVRYQRFKEKTWSALQSLKEIYHYHFINAEGAVADVEAKILDELRYQSSLELEQETFDRLRQVPLASEIIVRARQALVERLNSYERDHRDLFARVVAHVQDRVMPIVLSHAVSGMAIVSIQDPVFDDELALAMLIDVFSERGYHVVIDKRVEHIAERVDLTTGEVHHRRQVVFRAHIHFKRSEIQRG